MTSATKRALPWLLSAGAHVVALAAVAILLAFSPGPLGPRVEISLVGGAGSGGGGAVARTGARSTAASKGPALPARASARSTAPNAPVGSTASAASTSAAPGNGTPLSSWPASYSADASRTAAFSAPAPSASDVLNDTESASAGAQEAVGTSSGQAAAVPGGAPGPLASGAEWGWQGLPRKLVRKRSPEFPAILSALGQEVEGEARITVAPSGIVTRVEITRSSGYIEIDASVEAALRDYLFSRVDGRLDSTGTVKFRFRLEKQD